MTPASLRHAVEWAVGRGGRSLAHVVAMNAGRAVVLVSGTDGSDLTCAQVAAAQAAVDEDRSGSMSVVVQCPSQQAADPNTPVEALLQIAHVCPDKVLANPALPLVALSDPAAWHEIHTIAWDAVANTRALRPEAFPDVVLPPHYPRREAARR